MKPVFLACIAAVFAVMACELGETEVRSNPGRAAPQKPAAASGLVTELALSARLPAKEASEDTGERPRTHPLLGERLPAFNAPSTEGGDPGPKTPDRWTVIHIWGAWCHDSVEDGPYSDALARAVAQDPGLEFLSIHVPEDAASLSPDKMFGKYGSLDAYFKSAGYTLPVLLDADGSLREQLKIDWTPTYLLVSPNRVVRGFSAGLEGAGGEPVKDFLRDVAAVRARVRSDALEIGPGGVGGMTGRVPFTITAIEAAFPGHEVVADTDRSGSAGPLAMFRVRRPGSTDTRFEVRPDWTLGFIGSVATTAADVTGPGGARIGDIASRAEAFPGTTLCTAVPHKDGERTECVLDGGLGTYRATLSHTSGSEARLDRMEYLPIAP